MKRRNFAALSVIGMILTACSGGGGSGDGGTAGGPALQPSAPTGNPAAGTPVSTVGRIDAFGSIFVNGIEFETDRATYRIDDTDSFDDSALSVGMIVRVTGTRDDNGHGIAERIYYDDEIEGPVANLEIDPADDTIKRFTIFGTPILANAATTVFRGEHGATYGFENLSDGDHIEVSGDFDGDTIIASFIKLEDGNDDDFEARGIVSEFDGTSFMLSLRSGNSLQVALAAGAQIPAAGIMDGQFVEVEGSIPDPVNAPNGLLARRVEIEHHDDFHDDDDDHHSGSRNDDDDEDDEDDRDSHRHDGHLEGILNFDGDVWSVRMTQLQFDAASEYRPASLEEALADGSAAGQRVKVRGNAADGILLVERIELELEDDVEIKGILDSVSASDADDITTLAISFPPAEGTVTVLVSSQTLLKNDDGMLGFELSDLVPGTSYLEIQGHLDGDGNLVACVLEAEDHLDEYELEGPLDADGFVDGNSISVLGVTFVVDGSTRYKDGRPMNGDHVEIEDENRDGIADEVDVED